MLTATTSAATPGYLWSPGGATTASITVSPGTTTIYTVKVTDGVTGCTNTASGTVTVNPATVASALSPVSIRVGQSATFNTTASGTGPFTYVWRRNGGAALSSTSNSILIKPAGLGDAGNYSVEVSGTCGSVTNSAALTVRAANVVYVSDTPNTNLSGTVAFWTSNPINGSPDDTL